MPPSSGWREDSSRTVRPSGTNKARKAITHSARALGPAAAAAAIQRVLTTAATRNRTTSRKPRTRRKPGAAASSAMVIAAWLPAHMASANLACQARASYPYSQPPVRVDFQALVANGVVPLGFHWDFGDG